MSAARRIYSTILALVAAACAAHSGNLPKPQTSVVVRNPECYTLLYTEPVKNAEPKWFPVWLELLPGSDSGSVVGRPHPDFSRPEWSANSSYRWWKQIPGDSIEVNFSGSSEAIHIHVKRLGSRLVGRATHLTDVLEPNPQPSMHVEGTPALCPPPEQNNPYPINNIAVTLSSGTVVRIRNIVVFESRNGKGLTLYVETPTPASEADKVASEAKELAEVRAKSLVGENVSSVSVGVCRTQACLEMREIPREMFSFLRRSDGSLKSVKLPDLSGRARRM